jgi:mono/diheme cytochrome c family protein
MLDSGAASGSSGASATRCVSRIRHSLSACRGVATRLFILAIGALLGVAFAAACGKPRELTAVDRGEVIYRTNCISCHNSNPNVEGALGPAIAGAPRALIEARVLHGNYPPGYHPQRKSHTMRALPWLDGHVDDLTAYLAAAKANHTS